MKVGHVNVNNLSNKLNYISNLLDVNCLDCLGISESWLTPDTSDSFVSLPNYNICRADSLSGSRIHGVAMYIRCNIKYLKIDCTVDNVLIVYLVDYCIYLVTWLI